ncbi:MAG: tRNA epoxyqueuosine(34) reductase QueG [Burkholderiaceae bacterium]
MSDIKKAIRAGAQRFGFDAVGFASSEADPEDSRHLRQYLDEGRQGDMDWMARGDRRSNPQAVWGEARTIICLGVNYAPAEDALAVRDEADRAAISVYARGRDYHDVLKKRLKAFGRWLHESYNCGVKVFVDTAPVMEKPLAMRAGLGWIGKHTNLVSRRYGSWLFLGEVFTTLELPADPREVDHCGSCDACVRACPTGALDEPYRIEPRRCLSYLTIEHKGDIAPELASAFGNRVYGCDDCLVVCPWNKFATPTLHIEFHPRADLAVAKLADLVALDESAFRALFGGTAIKRIGRDRMRRNVRIAIDHASHVREATADDLYKA